MADNALELLLSPSSGEAVGGKAHKSVGKRKQRPGVRKGGRRDARSGGAAPSAAAAATPTPTPTPTPTAAAAAAGRLRRTGHKATPKAQVKSNGSGGAGAKRGRGKGVSTAASSTTATPSAPVPKRKPLEEQLRQLHLDDAADELDALFWPRPHTAAAGTPAANATDGAAQENTAPPTPPPELTRPRPTAAPAAAAAVPPPPPPLPPRVARAAATPAPITRGDRPSTAPAKTSRPRAAAATASAPRGVDRRRGGGSAAAPAAVAAAPPSARPATSTGTRRPATATKRSPMGFAPSSHAAISGRVVRSDPVARFHAMQRARSMHEFLSTKAKAKPGAAMTPSHTTAAAGTPRPSTASARRSRTPKFVPPTEKRRDNLRLQIRERMRKIRDTAMISPRKSRPAMPSSYTVPTDKPRRALIWKMRTQLGTS